MADETIKTLKSKNTRLCKATLGQMVDYVNEKAVLREKNEEREVTVRVQHKPSLVHGFDAEPTFDLVKTTTREVDLRCLNCLDNILPGSADVP